MWTYAFIFVAVAVFAVAAIYYRIQNDKKNGVANARATTLEVQQRAPARHASASSSLAVANPRAERRAALRTAGLNDGEPTGARPQCNPRGCGGVTATPTGRGARAMTRASTAASRVTAEGSGADGWDKAGRMFARDRARATGGRRHAPTRAIFRD